MPGNELRLSRDPHPTLTLLKSRLPEEVGYSQREREIGPREERRVRGGAGLGWLRVSESLLVPGMSIEQICVAWNVVFVFPADIGFTLVSLEGKR